MNEEKNARIRKRWRLTEPNVETPRVQPTSTIGPAITCAHSRLISEILTTSEKRTGMVRCAECGTEFEDPHVTER